MKISRHKKIHKHLNFYINNYGFHAPYQILVDGTFCYAALKNKNNIKEVLPKYFQAELKFLTTPCIIIETEKLGGKIIGAMIIVKQFGVHKCTHVSKPVSGAECIKSMIARHNPNRYFIATQDRELQEHVRTIPGTPLLYLHQKTPVLERPSDTSVENSKLSVAERLRLSENEVKMLEELKKKSGIEPVVREVKKRKKRKSGPNPLSCKKKKKKPEQPKSKSVDENKVKKRKKKRIRIPEHVKQELLNKNKDLK